MILWLVGMMGSGKTSAGRTASAGLGVPFQDTDSVVEAASGRTVAEIWETDGEAAFRRLEVEAVAGVSRGSGIVATGGGVVLDEGNRERMRNGPVVWLQASPTTLAHRLIGQVDRPGMAAVKESPEEFLRDVLAARAHLYEAVATHRIEIDAMGEKSVAAAVEVIWND